eukprot:8502842-Ditylum_brightwellii.AAC.1
MEKKRMRRTMKRRKNKNLPQMMIKSKKKEGRIQRGQNGSCCSASKIFCFVTIVKQGNYY